MCKNNETDEEKNIFLLWTNLVMKSEGGPLSLNRDIISSSSPTKNNNSSSKNKRHICPKCGLFINSEESLKVHMQYQHENMSRWGVPTTTMHSGSLSIAPAATASASHSSTTSLTALTNNNNNNVNENVSATTSGGNLTSLTNLSTKSSKDSDHNHHKNKKNQLRQQVVSPLTNNNNNNNNNSSNSSSSITTNVNSTISAAADSSNNQSPTPGLSVGIGAVATAAGAAAADQGIGPHNFSVSNASYQPHHHHHHQHHLHHQGNLIPQEMHAYNPYVHGYEFPPHPIMDSSMYPMPYQTGTEYKSVPSNRYHPYHNPQHHLQHHQANQQATTNGTNTASSSASNSSLSPRVVSSSSPTQNSIMGQQTGGGTQDSNPMTHIPQGQPTPSPSPKQCDKCGYVCQTDAQLNEHYSSTHGIQQNEATSRPSGNGGDENDMQQQYSYQPYIKEEPSSDILDLDSQKMIYPASGPVSQESLPSMHSMHAMHRSSLMWGPEMHSGYIPHSQTDIKQSYFPPMRPPYTPIKQEYANIKQEYSTSSAGYGNQVIKSEFNAHHQPIIPQSRADIKPFNTDITPGNNPASSSPSEFPSTTTPQDNGSQFRGFEPPTSSLPNNAPTTKSAAWKSNEARRPKTYNCTACNKWFTSSGHLKRHYNTTLHKNAVKSSGQPDPATMPISAHHHPARDPNSKHHRNSQSQQPPPVPPEPPRSPEYTPQYTPPPGGFTQATGSFQQYNPSTVTIHSNGHPNGQAGPSDHASQQRGLLTISTTEAMCSQHQEEEDHSLQQREEQYHQVLEQINPGHQDQLQQETHFILAPHMSVQQDTTSPHHTITHNIMEQQYIINHLPINTPNITQSFQRTLQAEAHQSLHTITGNDSHLSNDSENLHLMDSIAYETADQQQHHHHNQQYQIVHQIQTTEDGHQVSHITTLNPSSLVELHRLSQSQNNIVYPHNVPELTLPGSPQEADIAPQHQAGRITISGGNSGSPNMPSTTTTILMIPVSPEHHQQMYPTLENNNNNTNNNSNKIINNNNNKNGIRPASNMSNTDTSSAALSPTPSSSSTSTTSSSTAASVSVSGSSSSLRVECRECGKEFAKACYLTQHNKTLHSGEQPYRCQKCALRPRAKRFKTTPRRPVIFEKVNSEELQPKISVS